MGLPVWRIYPPEEDRQACGLKKTLRNKQMKQY